MLLWLVAILLLASLAGLGYRQGAIRVAFSLVGIIIGAILAAPLGGLLHRPIKLIGVQNPALVWFLCPVIVFIVISIIAKAAAYPVHLKADVHFKYHAGELRMLLWERLSRRLGLCLGVVNGSIYLVLISFLFYSLSYWTIQVATPDADPASIKWLNRFGTAVQDTGFVKVIGAVASMPQDFYDAADVAGLIYQNSLIGARLKLYPGTLGLAERPEFQALGDDKAFAEMRQSQKPIREVMDEPQVAAILQNPDLLQQIWTTTKPDLKDMKDFLETGKSPKYDPIKILGRWDFNGNAAYVLLRRAKPNMTSNEAKQIRRSIGVFDKASFVATTDNNKAVLKNLPTQPQTLEGQWKDLDDKYQLTFSGGGADGDAMATIENDRMVFKLRGIDLVFDREE